MAPHSSTLAWKIPWTEEPGRLQSMGLQRLSDFTSTYHFHALEKEMTTHSSVLAWRIPGTGEPGGLPSMGSHMVGHDWSDIAVAAADFKLIRIRLFRWVWTNHISPLRAESLSLVDSMRAIQEIQNRRPLLLKAACDFSNLKMEWVMWAGNWVALHSLISIDREWPQLTVNRETGPQSYNHKKLNSHNLNEFEKEPQISDVCIGFQSRGPMSEKLSWASSNFCVTELEDYKWMLF